MLIMTAVHGLEVNLASLGASEVVEKPFNVDDLLNKVALAVYRSRDADRHQPAAAVAAAPSRLPSRATAASSCSSSTTARGSSSSTCMLSRARLHGRVDDRALVQLSRLARALRPRAILLELTSEGVADVVARAAQPSELDDPDPRVHARPARRHMRCPTCSSTPPTPTSSASSRTSDHCASSWPCIVGCIVHTYW